jgi:DNA-directed RNA polymerase sigma subunit (sigma70/sigma32)
MPSLPLYPTDDGWPYPDPLSLDPATPVVGEADPVADEAVDLDLLELTADPHAYADLTELEYFAVSWRYGVGDGANPHSMKELAAELGCTHAEARDVLGGALDKLRRRLLTE